VDHFNLVPHLFCSVLLFSALLDGKDPGRVAAASGYLAVWENHSSCDSALGSDNRISGCLVEDRLRHFLMRWKCPTYIKKKKDNGPNPSQFRPILGVFF